MAQSHETGDSTVDNGHNAVATDPNIAEIQERFRVSEPTAEVISVLDDGGIHAGGGAPDEWREHSFAGTTAGTEEAWATARDKGGMGRNWSPLSPLIEKIASVGKEPENGVRAFSSDSPEMEKLTSAGLTMEEARNFVVYSLTLGRDVKAKDTEMLRPMNIHPTNPTILLGKGTFTPFGDGRPKTLEVTTTVNSEGQVIGFSAASRRWDYDKDGVAA